GAHVDVAALAVGDHEQIQGAGMGRDGTERAPSGFAQRLKAGKLELDRDAGRRGGRNQRAAVRDDRGRHALAHAVRLGAVRPRPAWLTGNFPKPDPPTSLPRRSASSIVASTASMARLASCLVSPARSATWSTSSDFVTGPSSCRERSACDANTWAIVGIRNNG